VKKLLPLVALLVAAYFGWSHFNQQISVPGLAGGSDTVLANAFDQQRSGFQTQGEGVVIRILSDDNDGSRHQRFILKLQSGQTLLIAHNIDVAPRVSSLREGDVVAPPDSATAGAEPERTPRHHRGNGSEGHRGA
jgi:hypothetical protein